MHSCLGKIWFICSRRLVVLVAVVSVRCVVGASRIGVTCAVGLPAKNTIWLDITKSVHLKKEYYLLGVFVVGRHGCYESCKWFVMGSWIDGGVVDERRCRSSSKLVESMEWRCGISQAEKRCSLGMVLCNGIKSGVEGECRLAKQRI